MIARLKSLKIIWISALIMAMTPMIAQALPGYCDSQSVHQIQRPYAKGAAAKPSFIYRYSLGSEIRPNDPVVIFIPGGPGQTSMDMSIAIPSEFQLVRIDPRGVGCNEVSDLSDEDFNSEVLARDVLAVVRDLKLKKYIIHGISYGTIVATMAASLAESEGTPPPSAVVLEGVIGRAFQPGEYIQAYFDRWAQIKTSVSPEVLDLFKRTPLPFGLSSQEWAAWISSNLIFGILPDGENYLLSELANLEVQHIEQQKFFRNRVVRAVVAPSEAKTRLYRQIACREMVPDVRDVKYDFDFIGGNLTATDKNLCSGLTLDRGFDAKKYPVKSPLYYFSGDLDPVTPPAQARYHFDSQTGPRTLLTVHQGGHQPLSVNMGDCSPEIWRALATGITSRVITSLKDCSLTTQVDQK